MTRWLKRFHKIINYERENLTVRQDLTLHTDGADFQITIHIIDIRAALWPHRIKQLSSKRSKNV